jgi:hypothetical protein
MKIFLVLILALVCFVNFASGQVTEKLFINVGLQSGQDHPVISGTIKNEKGEPIEGAIVQISSPIGTAETKSDSNGVFVYNFSIIPAENKFNISVKAQKEGYLAGYANTSFFIKSENQTNVNKTPLGTNFTIATTDSIKNDPIAFKILQNIELNKQKEAEKQRKLQEIVEQQKFIAQQREIANQNLLDDLQSWFGQFDPFNPRNAFATFASQFDSAIQSIYWGQFNFTETKRNEGLAALQEVLNNGGTQQDARKAFYEKATITQSDINKLNNDLNAKYGRNNTHSRLHD